MEGRFVLILALTAAIGGMSGQYSVQMLTRSSLGYSNDYWEMLATVVTLVLVLCAITSLQFSDNMIAPMILTGVVLIVWVLYFFFYLIDWATRGVIISIIYIVMSGSAVATHVITGSLKSKK